MPSRPVFPTISRSLLVAFFISLLFVSFLTMYLWSVIPRPLLVLAISLRIAAFVLAVIAFVHWKEWRILPLALMIFLMSIRLTLVSLENAGIIPKAPFTTTMHETLGFVITMLAFFAVVYLWNLFSYRAKVKQAESRQAQSEEELRTIIDYSYDWEVWLDLAGRCKYMSPSCERITGYTREEFMGNPDLFLKIIHPDDYENVRVHRQQHSLPNCEKSEMEFRIITKSGETRWIWHQCQAALDQQKNWLGRRASNRDITFRHEIESTLRQDQAMFMNGPVVIFLWRNSVNWPVEYVSESVFDILGYSDLDFIDGSMLYASLIHPDDSKRVLGEVNANSLPDSDHFTHEPYRLIAKDGRIVWVLDSTTLVRDASGRISHFHGYLVDITRTVQMEEEVLATKDRLEFIIDAARLGTWDWNVPTGVVVFNSWWADILGYTLDELEPNISTWKKLVHPDDASATMQLLTDHLQGRTPVYMSEHRLRHKLGNWVWILAIGKVFQWDQEKKPLRTLGIQLDISKQKDQEQLALETSQRQEQVKRIESLKTMAGAVAHRFNNSMMVVLGNLEMLRRILPAESNEMEMVSMASQAAKEATKVGSSMLTYVGQGIPRLQPEDLVDLVRDVLFICQEKFPSSITYHLIPPTMPMVCKFDKIQIREVLKNVLTNAIESLVQGTGHIEITFGSASYSSAELPIIFRDGLPSTHTYVFCQITDNGCGIAPEVSERIFEPFFTSKFVGRGLGLALAAGVMRSHHGALLVQSTVSEGTTVRVLLPEEKQ